MAEKSSYRNEIDAKNFQLTKNVLAELPSFVSDYIYSRFASVSSQTLLQYTYSLRRFFDWMQKSIPHLSSTPMREITCDDLARLTARDIEEFMMFLQMDTNNTNSRAGVSQKIAAVGSLFSYLYRHDDIPADPCAKVERPKLVRDKRIIYLTDDEAKRLLDTIEFGHAEIPPHQLTYLEATRCRDLAIATVMLDTGIRLSECVGLNIEDVNMDERRIQVYRKGGKYQYLPINTEVVEILQAYLQERKRISPKDPSDAKALFLSMQERRITKTAVENMIKKYALLAGIAKPITPHKLRKTYGTALYRKTRDIYLTANALGHENVATTSKHYVDDTAESLREIADAISVRTQNIE